MILVKNKVKPKGNQVLTPILLNPLDLQEILLQRKKN